MSENQVKSVLFILHHFHLMTSGSDPFDIRIRKMKICLKWSLSIVFTKRLLWQLWGYEHVFGLFAHCNYFCLGSDSKAEDMSHSLAAVHENAQKPE